MLLDSFIREWPCHRSHIGLGLDDILKSVALAEYTGVFKKENIDVEMLIDLDTDEFMNMTKKLGITTWGHRQTEIEKSNKTIKIIKFWN